LHSRVKRSCISIVFAPISVAKPNPPLHLSNGFFDVNIQVKALAVRELFVERMIF